ncbi:hypothetical protein BD410DRAFT_847152 [Rickenella mellea]|uniref:Uncharacterized protein n=1 Tax=Rickenella mellea TaxID=50990 RepID=A0A4Y7PE28_9AGAM|nr:hypothetical protein BD410DRAFT_847152 [Rickenella mellea]
MTGPNRTGSNEPTTTTTGPNRTHKECMATTRQRQPQRCSQTIYDAAIDTIAASSPKASADDAAAQQQRRNDKRRAAQQPRSKESEERAAGYGWGRIGSSSSLVLLAIGLRRSDRFDRCVIASNHARTRSRHPPLGHKTARQHQHARSRHPTTRSKSAPPVETGRRTHDTRNARNPAHTADREYDGNGRHVSQDAQHSGWRRGAAHDGPLARRAHGSKKLIDYIDHVL